MNDEIWVFFGCSLLVAVPTLLVVVLAVLYRRQKALTQRLDEQGLVLEALRRRLDEGLGPGAERPVVARAPAPATAPSAAPEPEAPAVPAVPETPAVSETLAAPDEVRVEQPLPKTSPARAASPPPTPPVQEQPAPPSPPARPPRKPLAERFAGLEETLWTRLPVWIGAIALALAGAYMVKLSFERGWISPPVRVTLGALFGAALLVGGELLRRSSATVAQGLAAAGVAALYAAFYAAYGLYALVPAWLGFALLALTTGVALGLALRQGAVVAVVGLVGGFATPALVSTETPSPGALFAYLALLLVALVAVARRRRWGWLGAASLVGALAWVFAWLGGPYADEHTPIVGVFLLAAVAAFIVRPRGRDAWRGPFDGLIGAAAVAGALLAAGTLAHRGGFGNAEWAFLALLVAAALAVARLGEASGETTDGDEAKPSPAGGDLAGGGRFTHGLAWLAAGWVFTVLAGWMSAAETLDPTRWLVVDALFAVLLVGGAYIAHHGSRHAGAWASLSAVSAVAAILLPALQHESLGFARVPWGVVCLGVAGLLTLLVVPVARRRGAGEVGAGAPMAALTVGVTTLVALAAALELERAWLSVAWAVQILVVVWLAQRLRLRALVAFAWLLVAVVGVRLLLNPMVLDYPIGMRPLVNWLLYGYGVPIAAVAAALVLLVRRDASLEAPRDAAQALYDAASRRLADGLGWLLLGLTTVFVLLQIRQVFHPGQLALFVSGGEPLVAEMGSYVVALLALAALVLRLADRWPEPAARYGARALGGLGLLAWALPMLPLNPLWSGATVGTWILVDRLAWTFAVPAALALWLAQGLAARGSRRLPALLRLAALVGAFLYVTLETLHLFRGPQLEVGPPNGAIVESWAISFAWVFFGTVLAVAGATRGGRLVRWASLAVLLLAVGKVFLVDTGSLGGFYRVLSLVGLGLSLIGLAYLYQRLVFRTAAADDTNDTNDTDAASRETP
ncbi:MAG: DUF2339 domain-containing protein [Acidobacteriota bacterium]